MLIEEIWGHVQFICYVLIFKTLFSYLCERNIAKHLRFVKINGMRPHIFNIF